jgi:uncharacterized protein
MTAGERFAAALRGFGPLGLLAFVIVVGANLIATALAALLVLLWALASRTRWQDLGLVRPRSWVSTLLLGILSGAAFKLVMKALVMPLFGAPPLNAAYQYLVANRAALPGALLMVTVGAGFGEELVFRGYLFERLGKLLGSDALGRSAIVVLTAALFGLAHYAGQGVPGVQQATITGLVFGSIFAITGHLWTLVFAHAAFDVTAVLIIYWNLESKVAHLFFK